MTTPTILSDQQWPEAILDMRSGFAGRLNVYRMMAHNPALLRAWETLRNHVVINSALTPVQSETVILRTGWHWGSRYEWTHHVYRGTKVGMQDATIARCAQPGPDSGEDIEGALIRAVDSLMEHGKLDVELRAELLGMIGMQALLDVMATVGMYTNLAFIIETFDVPIDEDVLVASEGPMAFEKMRG